MDLKLPESERAKNFLGGDARRGMRDGGREMEMIKLLASIEM